MQNHTVSNPDTDPVAPPRFTRVERAVIASGAFGLSIWIGALAWVGYKLAILII